MAALEKSKEDLVALTRQIVSGKLAGTITHKAKNILMPITGYVELIEGGVSLDKQKGYFKKIESAGQGLQLLLKNFLRFSRALKEREEEEIGLSGLIGQIISLFEHHIILSKVILEKEIDSGIEKCWGVYDDISLIFASVLLNAIEASPQGGSIRLRVKGVNNRVHISIEDDGPGINEDIKDKIFEPFFTTREGNLGIGLAASLFLAKRMSGDITLEDKNRFIISLCKKKY